MDKGITVAYAESDKEMPKKTCPLCGEEFTPKTSSHEELGNLTEKICVDCIEEYNLIQKKTYELL